MTKDFQFITEKEFQEGKELCSEICKIVNGLINSIKKIWLTNDFQLTTNDYRLTTID